MALTKIGTDGVKDDAITSGKIPANAVGSSELADNAVDTAAIQDDAVTGDKIAAGTITNSNIQNGTIGTSKIGIGNITTDKIAAGNVTTAKIADQAVTLAKLEHGTSSNDGKFLRANNGADPTFETVSGTTINNNAAQRVVTGDSSANTLNGQSNLTFDGNDLTVTGIAPCVNLTDTDSDDYKISNTQGVLAIRDTTAGADRFVINDNGTGYYTITFTNAMSNDDYSRTCCAGENANTGGNRVAGLRLPATGSFNIVIYNTSGGINDVADLCGSTQGDLA